MAAAPLQGAVVAGVAGVVVPLAFARLRTSDRRRSAVGDRVPAVELLEPLGVRARRVERGGELLGDLRDPALSFFGAVGSDVDRCAALAYAVLVSTRVCSISWASCLAVGDVGDPVGGGRRRRGLRRAAASR